MITARDQILKRLRATPIATLPALPAVQDWFAAHARSESKAQQVARLRSALESVHTEVHETSHAGWAALLLQILAAKGLGKLLIGTGTAHGAELQALQPAGLQLVPYAQPVEQWRDTLFDDMPAALTLARSAVAETGSLILWPSPSEPRLMSLVPPVHFVLLDVQTVHTTLNTALRAEGWANGLPTNALLISGPSKTADIQQTLAYGAHGPRELVVLLRHPDGASA